jgi:glycine betaine catabolism A
MYWAFRMLPIGATATALTTKWLIHKDAVEAVDYDLQALTHVWTETNDQDAWDRGGKRARHPSPAHEPGRYSKLHERGVIQFVDVSSSRGLLKSKASNWKCRLKGSRSAGPR